MPSDETAARVNEGETMLTLDLQDEIDRRLSEVIAYLARSGMKHDTVDNVYTPLLALRDRLVPGKYS
jgi:hypothetical protein